MQLTGLCGKAVLGSFNFLVNWGLNDKTHLLKMFLKRMFYIIDSLTKDRTNLMGSLFDASGWGPASEWAWGGTCIGPSSIDQKEARLRIGEVGWELILHKQFHSYNLPHGFLFAKWKQ